MKTTQTLAIATLTVAVLVSPLGCSWAGSDGINDLIAVTKMKADQANQEAMHAAEKQRENLSRKEQIRAAQKRLEAIKNSLSKVNKADPDAEEQVRKIDRELTSIRHEIQLISAAVTPTPEYRPRHPH